MKFWCEFPEDGDKAETCGTCLINRLHKLYNSAFLCHLIFNITLEHEINNVKAIPYRLHWRVCVCLAGLEMLVLNHSRGS